eukprot:366490-Chlamydomonas_euryale.AAC.16
MNERYFTATRSDRVAWPCKGVAHAILRGPVPCQQSPPGLSESSRDMRTAEHCDSTVQAFCLLACASRRHTSCGCAPCM